MNDLYINNIKPYTPFNIYALSNDNGMNPTESELARTNSPETDAQILFNQNNDNKQNTEI